MSVQSLSMTPVTEQALAAALADLACFNELLPILRQGNQMLSDAPAGTLATVTGLSVVEKGAGQYHHTILTFASVALATTDNGTLGAGVGQKVYTFPKGAIAVLGASQNWTRMVVDGTGLISTAAIDIGLGTTAAASSQETLSGAAQNVVQKKSLSFSTSLSALNQFSYTMSGANALDGSTTAKDAYLNVSASAATSTAAGTITLSGTIVIDWINLGASTA